jgi:hypothetical protein
MKYFKDTGGEMKKKIEELSERLQQLFEEVIKYDKQENLSYPLSVALDKLEATVKKFNKDISEESKNDIKEQRAISALVKDTTKKQGEQR